MNTIYILSLKRDNRTHGEEETGGSVSPRRLAHPHQPLCASLATHVIRSISLKKSLTCARSRAGAHAVMVPICPSGAPSHSQVTSRSIVPATCKNPKEESVGLHHPPNPSSRMIPRDTDARSVLARVLSMRCEG